MPSVLLCVDCSRVLPSTTAALRKGAPRCGSCLAMFQLSLGLAPRSTGLRAEDDGDDEEESGGDEEDSSSEEASNAKDSEEGEGDEEETDDGKGGKKKKAKKEVVGLTLALNNGGTGSLTKAESTPMPLQWKTLDAKSAEFIMNDSANKLWTNEAKGNFNFELTSDRLTLTPASGSGKAMTFTRVVEEASDRQSDDSKRGGAGKPATPKKNRK
jgi:hypothetical protein